MTAPAPVIPQPNPLVDVIGRTAGGRHEHDIYVRGVKTYTENPDTPAPPKPSGKVWSLNPKDPAPVPEPGDVVQVEGGTVNITPGNELVMAPHSRLTFHPGSRIMLNGNFTKGTGITFTDGCYIDGGSIDNRQIGTLDYSYPLGFCRIWEGDSPAPDQPICAVINNMALYGQSDVIVCDSFWQNSPGQILVRNSTLQSSWDSCYGHNTGWKPDDWTSPQYPASLIFSFRNCNLVSLGKPIPDFTWWTVLAADQGACMVIADSTIGQMGMASAKNQFAALFHAWAQGTIVLGNNVRITQGVSQYGGFQAGPTKIVTAVAVPGMTPHKEGQPSYIFDFGNYVTPDKFIGGGDAWLVAKKYVE